MLVVVVLLLSAMFTMLGQPIISDRYNNHSASVIQLQCQHRASAQHTTVYFSLSFPQVFGPSAWLWWVPVPSPLGDGLTFPTNSLVVPNYSPNLFSPSTQGTSIQRTLSADDYDDEGSMVTGAGITNTAGSNLESTRLLSGV